MIIPCHFYILKYPQADKKDVGILPPAFALAIAYAALQKLDRVKFYLFDDLARLLLQAKEHGYEANFIARLERYRVLVID